MPPVSTRPSGRTSRCTSPRRRRWWARSTRRSPTARATGSRYGTGSASRNHAGASRWNRSRTRRACSASSPGRAASTFSWALARTVPGPSSPAGPGSPARNSEPASASVSPVSRVRYPSIRRQPPPARARRGHQRLLGRRRGRGHGPRLRDRLPDRDDRHLRGNGARQRPRRRACGRRGADGAARNGRVHLPARGDEGAAHLRVRAGVGERGGLPQVRGSAKPALCTVEQPSRAPRGASLAQMVRAAVL